MFSKNQTTCGNMAVKKHNNDSVTVISGYEYVRYVEANVTDRWQVRQELIMVL